MEEKLLIKKDEAFYSCSKTILVNLCKKTLEANKKVVSIGNIKERSEDDYEMDASIEDRILLEKYLTRLNPIHQEVIR